MIVDALAQASIWVISEVFVKGTGVFLVWLSFLGRKSFEEIDQNYSRRSTVVAIIFWLVIIGAVIVYYSAEKASGN